MPLILPIGDTSQEYIFGTAPSLGALLGPGQTITVVSADPATVLLTQDSPAKPVQSADASPTVPAGTPTIWSAVVSGPANSASPAQPNVPIVVTATVNNSDGSVAESLNVTVTM